MITTAILSLLFIITFPFDSLSKEQHSSQQSCSDRFPAKNSLHSDDLFSWDRDERSEKSTQLTHSRLEFRNHHPFFFTSLLLYRGDTFDTRLHMIHREELTNTFYEETQLVSGIKTGWEKWKRQRRKQGKVSYCSLSCFSSLIQRRKEEDRSLNNTKGSVDSRKLTLLLLQHKTVHPSL